MMVDMLTKPNKSQLCLGRRKIVAEKVRETNIKKVPKLLIVEVGAIVEEMIALVADHQEAKG